MPDDGVIVLRVAVHPDAELANNHAAMFTSADRGLSFRSQTAPSCSAANVSACSLPMRAGDHRPVGSEQPKRFGPTLSWELSIPQSACADDAASQPDQLLGIPYQTHIGRTNSSSGAVHSLGWNASLLSVDPDGTVAVSEPRIEVPVTGLPHPVLNDSTLDGGIRLASAHAYSGAGVTLPDGSLLALLTDVAYVSRACTPSKAHPCKFILAIRSTSCGRSWQYLSTVTDGGTEGSVLQLDDGRLLAVFRHNFQGAPYHSMRFKQVLSVNHGRSWGAAKEMRAAVRKNALFCAI
jgi:hypothetical protein